MIKQFIQPKQAQEVLFTGSLAATRALADTDK